MEHSIIVTHCLVFFNKMSFEGKNAMYTIQYDNQDIVIRFPRTALESQKLNTLLE